MISPTFVSTVLVPAGLIGIMFSLGLALAGADFKRLLQMPRAVIAGLAGQLIVLPVIALCIVLVLKLPVELAIGLLILSLCPGGVTSNAIVFAARADVALSVTLTVFSSIVTVLTTPVLISIAIGFFYPDGTAPELSVVKTMKTLFIMTALPVSLGMLVRRLSTSIANKLVVWFRPLSMIVLISVICWSVWMSLETVLEHLVTSGPAAWLLNILAMAAGLLLAMLFRLPTSQVMTVSIEVGVQNATMATFLTLSVLGSLELAIGPTIYGCIMVFHSAVLIFILKRKPLTCSGMQKTAQTVSGK